MNSITPTAPRHPHGMPKPRHLERTPLVITIVLHIVILVAFIWFGQNIKPLPVPKHIKAVILPPPSSQSTAESSPNSAKQALPVDEKPQKPQINKQEEAERKTADLAAAAAVQKAQALAEAIQQKRELAKQVELEKQQVLVEKQKILKEAAVKQAETEQKYALKKAKEAEKLKAELDAKRKQELDEKRKQELDEKHTKEQADKEAKKEIEKAKARLEEKKQAEEAKKLAAKEAAENAKTIKEAKLAQEKADKEAKAKAAKEQALNDAKTAKAAQEKADKMQAAKAAADAKRRLSQSLGNDDAELGNLKSQVAANAKANSIGKYKAQIELRIKSAWRVPSGSSGLKATARITLSADGSIASVVIISPSDSDDFNASIKALSGHSGLPVPDDSDTFRQVNPLVITFKAP